MSDWGNWGGASGQGGGPLPPEQTPYPPYANQSGPQAPMGPSPSMPSGTGGQGPQHGGSGGGGSDRGPLIAIIVFLVLAVGGGGVAYVLFSGDDDDGGEETTNTTEGEATTTTEAAPAEPEMVSWYDLEVGHCWNDPADEEASELEVVDCSQPHDNEVYAVFTVPEGDGEYPGDAAVEQQADDECGSSFTDFVGLDPDASIYSMYALPPNANTWPDGDREIVCNAYEDNEAPIEGSVKGANE